MDVIILMIGEIVDVHGRARRDKEALQPSRAISTRLVHSIPAAPNKREVAGASRALCMFAWVPRWGRSSHTLLVGRVLCPGCLSKTEQRALWPDVLGRGTRYNPRCCCDCIATSRSVSRITSETVDLQSGTLRQRRRRSHLASRLQPAASSRSSAQRLASQRIAAAHHQC